MSRAIEGDIVQSTGAVVVEGKPQVCWICKVVSSKSLGRAKNLGIRNAAIASLINLDDSNGTPSIPARNIEKEIILLATPLTIVGKTLSGWTFKVKASQSFTCGISRIRIDGCKGLPLMLDDIGRSRQCRAGGINGTRIDGCEGISWPLLDDIDRILGGVIENEMIQFATAI